MCRPFASLVVGAPLSNYGRNGIYILRLRLEYTGDSFGGMPVPQLGNASFARIAGENGSHLCPQSAQVASNHDVGPAANCHGPLCVLTQRQTAHAQECGFFLDPSLSL